LSSTPPWSLPIAIMTVMKRRSATAETEVAGFFVNSCEPK
jgi:hypothetical protein